MNVQVPICQSHPRRKKLSVKKFKILNRPAGGLHHHRQQHPGAVKHCDDRRGIDRHLPVITDGAVVAVFWIRERIRKKI